MENVLAQKIAARLAPAVAVSKKQDKAATVTKSSLRAVRSLYPGAGKSSRSRIFCSKELRILFEAGWRFIGLDKRAGSSSPPFLFLNSLMTA